MTTVLPQPPIAPPGPWSFPVPERARISNGIEVHVYRLPGQHVIAAHLVLDVPLAAEPRQAEGVAAVCARTLDEGTLSHAGEEFAELLETEGAGFDIDVSLSGLQAILDVPSTRLEAAFALFAEAVREPALAADDVNRHVQLRLAEIEQARANSTQTANTAFRRAVFSEQTRASRMNGGEPETVAAVTPEAVRQFHRELMGPERATLVLAGDFGADDPVGLAERCLGSWQVPGQQPITHQPAQPGPRRVLLVDRPGAVQADLRLGAFGVDRTDPRWADLTVAGYAVGGAFLSRLNKVLREERGYTYGVRLGFTPLRSGGWFAVQGSFRTDVLVDAVREARDLLDVTDRPIDAAEVDDAVSFYSGLSPLRYATADAIADQAATEVLAGLEPGYIDRSLADLRAVTPESATAAYASLVDLDALSLVVVGHADALADPLRAAGFTDLVVEG